MSEESEKLDGLRNVPVFPLPLVLLPFEMLPLHIFEPRYKEMLADISVGNNLFGVSLFEPANQFEDRPSIGSIGCLAEIRESSVLEDGRTNILTVGLKRYRITGYGAQVTPYLVAEIEFFDDEKDEGPRITDLADEVFELFRRVANAAHKLSGRKDPFPDVPKAPPEQLSFLVAAAFILDNKTKYELIEMRSTFERLERDRIVLAESVKQVEESAKIDRVSRTNGHSKKPPNLGF